MMKEKRQIIRKRQKRRKRIKQAKRLVFFVFLMMNIVGYFHAYQFTHFSNKSVLKTKKPEELSPSEKISNLVFGVSNPRPINNQFPTQSYKTFLLQSNKEIECWSIRRKRNRGMVILFHGYGSNKSALLEQSNVFISQGYNTLLVDFMGSGGSDGNQTTIGYFEAEEVKTAYDYARKKGDKRIFLYGASMGAVAIMKAVNDSLVNPTGIILECPFGSMYQTVDARFELMDVPSFPMAGMLVFWGGIQNGFWAFSHNPSNYAENISCPTLLMYGEQDPKVSRPEIDSIYAHLTGNKQLVIFPNTGHENYLRKHKDLWVKEVSSFLK